MSTNNICFFFFFFCFFLWRNKTNIGTLQLKKNVCIYIKMYMYRVFLRVNYEIRSFEAFIIQILRCQIYRLTCNVDSGFLTLFAT